MFERFQLTRLRTTTGCWTNETLSRQYRIIRQAEDFSTTGGIVDDKNTLSATEQSDEAILHLGLLRYLSQ